MKTRKIITILIITFALFFPFTISTKIPIQNRSLIGNAKNSPRIASNSDNTSIILLIGDGMGHEHLKLAKWVELGKNQNLNVENLPFRNNVTTYNAQNAVTDSAAAATAIATGYKTYNAFLSVLPDLKSVETILEISQRKGKSTGVISTTEITHATPAAFMTHVSSRNLWSEIARQIVEDSGVDVIMGGGRTYFTTEQITQMQNKEYQFVVNKAELQNISTGKVFGLFADSHLPYEIDRNYNSTPSLTEMTDKAIQLLSQDPDGFFLVIEGGRIDHAAHNHNKINVALETIEFHNAVERATSYVKNTRNSLLIVTADHETGGLHLLSETLNTNLPDQNRTTEENETLRINRAQNVTVSWSTTGHTNTNVPFYAFVNNNKTINNDTTIDNTEIFDIMNSFIGLETSEQIDYLIIIIIGLIALPSVSVVCLILYTKIKTLKKKLNYQ